MIDICLSHIQLIITVPKVINLYINCISNMSNRSYKNIVFEGGGTRGLAYVGVLKSMNNLDKLKYVKCITGTSIGSIFAVLAGCKCTNNEIDEYCVKFVSSLSILNDSIVKKTINFYTELGLHSNQFIYDSINSLLEKKLNIKNITFKQYFEKTGIDITIVGTCMTNRTTVYFNYKTYPNMEVSKAVQISTSIPLFFTIVKWDNKSWVDGGVVKNFAIDYYDNDSGLYNNETLGVFLRPSTSKDQEYSVNSLLELLEGIEDVQLEDNIEQSIKNKNKRNIIYIDTGTISSFNFVPTDEQRNFLINNGFESTNEFFNKESNSVQKSFLRSIIDYVY